LELGDISFVVQIIIFFLLIIGLPLSKSVPMNSKNLLRHGYLAAFALGLHTILVAIVMIIFAIDGYADIFSLPL
jgi:hypothetical protein